jgi:hypothetical protein
VAEQSRYQQDPQPETLKSQPRHDCEEFVDFFLRLEQVCVKRKDFFGRLSLASEFLGTM